MAEFLEVPKNGFAPSNESIAAHLQEQADWIEQSENPIRNVFMVIERGDGSVYPQTMGHPCDIARAIGVMTICNIRTAMGVEDEG